MRPIRCTILAGLAIAACAPAAPDERPASGLRLSTPRAVHASVVLGDGRVLLIGGCGGESCDSAPGSATVDAMDPATGTVTGAGRLTGDRIGAAAMALKDGKVLVLGGWRGPSPTAEAEIFDPATGRSRRIAPMAAARADAAVALLADGRILVAGGFDGADRLASTEIYDPALERFVLAGKLNLARSGAAIARLADGRILVAGGAVGAAGAVRATASSELFDPKTLAFSPAADLIEARYKHAAVALPDGRVLIVAGSDERDYRGKKDSLELYDPKQDAYRFAGRLRATRFKLADAALLLADGRVLIAGGAPRPEIYDPATGTLSQVDVDLGGAWNFMTADQLPDGRVLLAGGYSEGRIRVTDRVWMLRL